MWGSRRYPAMPGGMVPFQGQGHVGVGVDGLCPVCASQEAAGEISIL